MNLDAIAQEMKAAQDQGRQIEPFTDRVSGFDQGAAYDVARRIHHARVGEGAASVGRKIGFTNRDLWPVFGVAESIWAHLHDTTVVQLSSSRATCRIGRFIEPLIEPEIILHFAATPMPGDGPEQILACLDWIAHGFEIVQSHFPGYRFQAADCIADSSLHATLLVGEPQAVERLGAELATRLERFTLALSCNGSLRDSGRGSNVLGSPLLAAAHLMSVLAKQQAQPLQAGELVTTGSLTQALPIHSGETWSTTLDGIGLAGISVAFEE